MAKNYVLNIIKELTYNAKQIDLTDLKKMIKQITTAKHIFLAGAGRSGIVIQAFANRLLHLGFDVSVVGEISSPHSHPGDLLIICSGSGETKSLRVLAESAKEKDVKIVLVTTAIKSTIAGIADNVIKLPGKGKNISGTQLESRGFTQPMGTEFEQLAFLTFDGLVLELMNVVGETSTTMFARHADFE